MLEDIHWASQTKVSHLKYKEKEICTPNDIITSILEIASYIILIKYFQEQNLINIDHWASPINISEK